MKQSERKYDISNLFLELRINKLFEKTSGETCAAEHES